MATTQTNDVDELVAAAQDELGENFDDEALEQPEEAEAPEAPATGDDPLEREVPADRLSGYWKNKAAQSGKPVRFRDLIDGSETAEEKIRQQGEAANRAREEASVLRAQTQALQEMLREMRNPTQPRKPLDLADVGIHDVEEANLRDPARLARGTADLGARIAREQIDPRIQSVEQTVGQLQNTLGVMNTRLAADQARNELGVDQAAWQRLGPYLWAAAGADPRGTLNPEAWKDAYSGLKEAFPQVEPRTSLPKEGIVRGNPSGSSRPTPVRQATAQKPRVRGLVSAVELDLIKHGGLTPEQAREVSQRTEAILQRRESRE